MPSVYKYNLEQADFPFEQEDYGTLSGSVTSTVDYGSGLPVQSEPDYSTDLYYPPTPTPPNPPALPYLNFGNSGSVSWWWIYYKWICRTSSNY